MDRGIMTPLEEAHSPPTSIFQTFFRHRHLLAQFTRREVESQTRGSVLGTLWWVLNPLLMLAVFTVVFGMVMGGRFEGVEAAGRFAYPLGIFVGMSLLGLITETLNQSSMAIVGHSNLVQKVRFPTELLSVSKIGASVTRTLVSMVLAIIGIIFFGPGAHWQMLLIPVILLPLVAMALGLGWLLSAIGVYLRDSQHFMAFISMVIFYTSAVFYSPASIPEPIMAYLRFNPVLHAVDQGRNLLLWHSELNWYAVGYLYFWGVLLFFAGYYVFEKLKDGFADVL